MGVCHMHVSSEPACAHVLEWHHKQSAASSQIAVVFLQRHSARGVLQNTHEPIPSCQATYR